MNKVKKIVYVVVPAVLLLFFVMRSLDGGHKIQEQSLTEPESFLGDQTADAGEDNSIILSDTAPAAKNGDRQISAEALLTKLAKAEKNLLSGDFEGQFSGGDAPSDGAGRAAKPGRANDAAVQYEAQLRELKQREEVLRETGQQHREQLTAENSRLVKRVAELERALSASDRELKTIQDTALSTEELKAIKRSREIRRAKIVKLEQRIKELESLQQGLSSSQAAVAEEISKRKSIEVKLERAAAELGQVKGTLSQAEQEKQSFAAELAKMQAKLLQAASETQSLVAEREQLQQLVEEKRSLEAQRDKLVDQVIEYRRSLQSTQAAAEDASQREKQLEAQLVAARGELNTARQKLTALSEIEVKYAAAQKERHEFLENMKQAEAVSLQLEDAQLRLKAKEVEAAEYQKEVQNLTTNLSALRGQIQEGEAERAKIEAKLMAYRNDVSAKSDEITSLKGLISRAKERIDGLKNDKHEAQQKIVQLKDELRTQADDRLLLVKDLEEQRAKVSAKDGEISESRRQLSRSVEETKNCRVNLAQAERKGQRIAVLEREVVRLKNAVLLKDTEIDGLRTGSLTGRGNRAPAPTAMRTVPRREAVRSRIAAPAPRPPADLAADVMLVEIKAQKVNLRSGPGVEHSPVMQVRKGTRLTVENRQGDWFRVFTPTGSRAYVRNDVVQVVGNGEIAADEPVRTADPEPEKPPVKVSADGEVLVPFGRVEPPAAETEDEVLKAFRNLKAGVGANRVP